MSAGKRKKKASFSGTVLTGLICGLLLLNTYAYLRLSSIAEGWTLFFLPGNLSARTAQLAFILMLNNLALAGLLLVKRRL